MFGRSLILLLIALISVLNPSESLLAGERPNVLLICVDDLKPIARCFGGTAKTPHTDRLAARGLRFDRAYCNQSVCSPSRNALLTGLRSETLGIYELSTNFRKSRPDAITLPQAFLKAGYTTESLGKIFHVGHGNTDDQASWSIASWRANVVAYHLPESKAPTGLTREEALFSNQPAAGLPRGAAYESADVADNTYPDGALADETVRRLREKAQGPDKPFFMAVGFVKPHLPFCAPQKYWDLYKHDEVALPEFTSPPEGAPEYAPTGWGELRQYKGIPAQGNLTEEQQRTLIHGYHAATSFMDAQLGRVLDCLDETGLAKNTIIVFWGDHGWHLGDHGMWCKHSNYEQAARIPVIVVVPGRTPGRSTSSLIESVDIYPTLCELAGAEIQGSLDGMSLIPLLDDPTASVKDHILHVYPRGNRMGRAVRTDRWRLVEWKPIGAPPEDAELELYDYQGDPAETHNVTAEHPDVVRSLRNILAAHPEAKPQIKVPVQPDSSQSGTRRKQDRGKMFDRRDENQDGQLTREEFLSNQPDPDRAPVRFTSFDADKNGMLSKEEFVLSGKSQR